jgi:acyl-CoA synthetase (AMP-forming)/AMP-acid ligase II
VNRTSPRPASLASIHQEWLGSGRLAFSDLDADDGPLRLTYDAFDDLCARVAGGLARRGIGRDDRVGILAENSARWVAAFFAILRLGAVAVPLSPRQPDVMLSDIAGNAGVELVLADGTNRARVRGRAAVDLDADELLGEPLPPADVEPDDVAIHLSTSGSTGTPKGVLLSHRSQLFTLESWATVETSHTMERTLVAAPLFHKNGLGETKLGLWLGAEVLLQRRFEPRAYLEAAATYRCTTLSGVPTMFAMMLEHADLLERLDLSSVVGLEIGSAPFSEALLERVRDVFPRATIYNSYGTTEVAAIFGGHPAGLPAPRTSVGFPLPTVELRLVGERGQDANPGELWVRGEGVMNGYHDALDLTAAKIVDGWCRTGDVMFRDEDGWYHFVGRVDDMFVSGGENVYPMAVEQVLEQHPLIRQAAVVAVPDERKGALPVAFVVASSGARITEDDVQRWALDHLPASHHPRAVWFVDALPLAGTEKVDRRALEADGVGRFSRR